MNRNYLLYVIHDRGSTLQETSKILGIAYATLSRKLNEKVNGSYLDEREMNVLANHYKMTDAEILKAFFNRD